MYLKKLSLFNFRCFAQAEFRFDAQLTWIQGANGTGKSALLEAIYLLSRGKSFRTPHLEDVHHQGQAHTAIAAYIEPLGQLGWGQHKKTTQLKINQALAGNQNQISRLFPLLLIAPDQNRWLIGQPQARRSLLDWSLYYLNPDFYPQWHSYRKALAQRNQALKAKWPLDALSAWDESLIQSAQAITQMRHHQSQQLEKTLQQLGMLWDEPLLKNIHLSYEPGWAHKYHYEEALAASLSQDQLKGYTHVGPHRGDLQIYIEDISWHKRLSRGQQKRLSTSLYLAQAHAFADDRKPLILIDDFGAELDKDNQQKLHQWLQAYPGQSLLTTLNDPPQNASCLKLPPIGL